jgi:hypothetical protein
VADRDAAFVQHILHITMRKRETNVHHHGQAYDLRARLEVTKGGTFCHPERLCGRPARIKKISSDSAFKLHNRGTNGVVTILNSNWTGSRSKSADLRFKIPTEII